MFQYSVYRLEHADYGAVIYIERNEDGTHAEAWKAVQVGFKEQRLWKQEGINQIRFLIDDQIMSNQMAEVWAQKEYFDLPKCFYCFQLIKENIFQHPNNEQFFCSKSCSNLDYEQGVEKINNEEECDFR